MIAKQTKGLLEKNDTKKAGTLKGNAAYSDVDDINYITWPASYDEQ